MNHHTDLSTPVFFREVSPGTVPYLRQLGIFCPSLSKHSSHRDMSRSVWWLPGAKLLLNVQRSKDGAVSAFIVADPLAASLVAEFDPDAVAAGGAA